MKPAHVSRPRSGYCERGCLHPHIHCVVPAGGLSADHKSWIRPKYAFFLPVDVLSSVFRAKFVHGLRKAFGKRKLIFTGSIAQLAKPKRFAAFVDSLFRQQWIVYAKPAFGAPIQVLRYLGRYTHRVAISNQQSALIGFRWRASHLPLERLRARQQAAEDDPASDGVSAPLHPAHSAARLRPHPAVRNPHQHPPIRITSARQTASQCCCEGTRDLPNRYCQQFHMAVSALQR